MLSTIPAFSKPSGTKDFVIQILGQEWPLSAKEIFNRVKKLSSQQISYQAVHKALGELLDAKVIEKNEKGYLLSLNWIDSGSQFFSSLHASYTHNFIKSVEGKTLEFDTLYAVDKFLIQSLQKLLAVLPPKPVLCLHWNHLWMPLFLSREDYASVKELGKFFNGFSLSKGSDPIDKWCADFWNKTGMESKLGIDVASTFDLIVVEDFVFEVFYSPEIKQKLNEIYSNTPSVKDLNIDDFFHSVFEKKTSIFVRVIKAPLLAEELRKQTLSFFKKA